MASVVSYQQSFKTGAGMTYPVVMKAPFAYNQLIKQYQVTTDDELAMGDLATVIGGELDLPVDKSLLTLVIILTTPRNQAILEARGKTPSKTELFKAADDPVDCLILVPGFVLSVKLAATNLIALGSKLCTSADDGDTRLLANSATDEPAAKIGMALSTATSGTGIGYIAMMVSN